MGIRGGMDFDGGESSLEVQSAWELEAEWTLTEEKAVWRSNQQGISRKMDFGILERGVEVQSARSFK